MATPVKNIMLKSPKILKHLSPTVASAAERSPNFFCSSSNRLKVVDYADHYLKVERIPSHNICSPVLDKNRTPSVNRNTSISHFVTPRRTPVVLKNEKSELPKFGRNKNKLLNIIGKGRFGTVVKGVYEGKLVAVKVEKLDSEITGYCEFNALNLNHENIVKIFEIVLNRKENCTLVVMEYSTDSRSLQHLLDGDQQQILDEKQVISFSKDITSGLSYLHSVDLLHLDLKPANILVTNNKCKICDFGSSVKLPILCQKFECHGTVAYISPEILKGELPTKKSDIYSLGILFWQMKYNKKPFNELSKSDSIIYKVVKYNLRPMLSMDNSKDEFGLLFMDCWQSEPEKRPSAAEVLIKLKGLKI